MTLLLLLLRAQRYLRLVCGGNSRRTSVRLEATCGSAPKRQLLLRVGLTSRRCQTAYSRPHVSGIKPSDRRCWGRGASGGGGRLWMGLELCVRALASLGWDARWASSAVKRTFCKCTSMRAKKRRKQSWQRWEWDAGWRRSTRGLRVRSPGVFVCAAVRELYTRCLSLWWTWMKIRLSEL